MDYKNLLEVILTNLDEGIIVVDKNANVTFFNEPATEIAGLDPNKALGKNILELFPDLTEETSTFYNVLKTKKPLIDYVQTYTNIKGKKVTIVTSTMPIIQNGELIGAVEIYRDITNLKDLAEKIVSLQKELYKKSKNPEKYSGNGTIYTIDDIIGKSKIIQELKNKALKVANSDSPIFIYGETGVGKELFVQAIHNANTKRCQKPFIAQNCAAIPKTLLESILFGISAGSFTGAKEKAGLFELANGGTLYLDEINSMDLELQAKLLRVLQDGFIRRVGGEKAFKVDVRITASSNEDPKTLISKGSLRQDLFYRLHVISLYIPPLRERIEDIPLLIEYYLNYFNKKLNKNIKGISDDAMNIFINYHWPGNVRELKSVIESIVNFTENNIIKIEDIPEYVKNITFPEENGISLNFENPVNIESLKEMVENFEKKIILLALQKSNGNLTSASKMLKIPKQTLHNKIKKYNIKKKIDYT